MTIRASEWIWQDGRLVPWAEATVHVLTHALHYGSSWFEGIRVYDTNRGPCFFRLDEHVRRLLESARIHRCPVPWSKEELIAACHQVVAANGLARAYVRPLVFRGYGTLSVDPTETPTQVVVAAVEWGTYLGAEGLESGVDTCVSSWQRVAPNTIPPQAKAGGNYLSSTLIHMEARRLGFDEGIGLAPDGTVGEGAGENIFVVREGVLRTPPESGSILPGLTRDAVFHLAHDLGLEVREGPIAREALYSADEIFLTGTAVEIMPVRSVDRLEVGAGGRGPITQRIQGAFFGLFDGSTIDTRGWLQRVRAEQP